MSDKPQSTYEEMVANLPTGIELMNNHILVGIYMRPEKTSGGIFLTDKTLDEDKWQGKVGAVLGLGPMAFVSDERNDFKGQKVEIGDWLVYRISDGFNIDINGIHCRLIEDVHVQMRVKDPTIIY